MILLNRRKGLRSCGFLDFQDALTGHRAYDLVSLFEDARINVPQSIVNDGLNLYKKEMKYDNTAWNNFMLSYHILGACRHAKVLGIFMHLGHQGARKHYLMHIKHVENLFTKKLNLASQKEFACFQPLFQIIAQIPELATRLNLST